MEWFGAQAQIRHPKKKLEAGGEQVQRMEQAAGQEGKICGAKLTQPAPELLTKPRQAEQRQGQNTPLVPAAPQSTKKGHSGGGTSLVALENHL